MPDPLWIFGKPATKSCDPAIKAFALASVSKPSITNGMSIVSHTLTGQWDSAELSKEDAMKIRLPNLKDEKGKIGTSFLWLLGVPFSILLLIFLLRGCT